MITLVLRDDVDEEEAAEAFASLDLPFSIGCSTPKLGGPGNVRLELHAKGDAARESLERLTELLEAICESEEHPDKTLARHTRVRGNQILHRELQIAHLEGIAKRFREALDTGCSLDQAFGLAGKGGGKPAAGDTAEEQFQIALARHRLGNKPGASDDVAYEYDCPKSKVTRAYKRFRTFLKAFVAVDH